MKILHSKEDMTNEVRNFLETGENNCGDIIRDGIYLNQHLLDQGFAVRMKE